MRLTDGWACSTPSLPSRIIGNTPSIPVNTGSEPSRTVLNSVVIARGKSHTLIIMV